MLYPTCLSHASWEDDELGGGKSAHTSRANCAYDEDALGEKGLCCDMNDDKTGGASMGKIKLVILDRGRTHDVSYQS
jgi:hypothetical protein